MQGLLDYWATRLLRAGRDTPDLVLADFNASLAPELEDARCPYLGLDAFRETKRDLFFGREKLVDEWLGRLKRRQRLLVAIGSSGSGKSSLVLAGLVPALKAGALAGSRDWRYLPPMVPGSSPLESLAQALQASDESGPAWIQQHVEAFHRDPSHLVSLLAESGDRTTVLVVDQFEELFSLCDDEAARQAFVNNLIHLIKSARPPPHRHPHDAERL